MSSGGQFDGGPPDVEATVAVRWPGQQCCSKDPVSRIVGEEESEGERAVRVLTPSLGEEFIVLCGDGQADGSGSKVSTATAAGGSSGGGGGGRVP